MIWNYKFHVSFFVLHRECIVLKVICLCTFLSRMLILIGVLLSDLEYDAIFVLWDWWVKNNLRGSVSGMWMFLTVFIIVIRVNLIYAPIALPWSSHSVNPANSAKRKIQLFWWDMMILTQVHAHVIDARKQKEHNLNWGVRNVEE